MLSDNKHNEHFDVIVVGAGSAGCAAAITAARCGMKTLLIEKTNALGGLWTTGLVNPMFDSENKDGITAEIVSRLKARGKWGGYAGISFHPEYMKVTLEEMAIESGVRILLDTVCVRTVCKDRTKDGAIKDRTIEGVEVENIEGKSTYRAEYVIDCTGDAQVAALSGCGFEIGEGNNPRKCQAMTLMFLVGNVPAQYRNTFCEFGKHVNAIYEKIGREAPFLDAQLIPIPDTSFAAVQFTHMYSYDSLSAADRTAATIEGRRQMMEMFESLRQYDDEFKDMELITSSGVIGVRESRRIAGEYRLTLDDLIAGRKCEDYAAHVTYSVDIHPADAGGQPVMYMVKPYDVPLACLIPGQFSRLLVAGRCISGSRDALASCRVSGNCCQMGESAGYAAAYALKKGIDVREIKNMDKVKAEFGIYDIYKNQTGIW